MNFSPSDPLIVYISFPVSMYGPCSSLKRVNMYSLIISVGIFSVNIFTSSGPLEIFKRYFRKSNFFIKDSHLSGYLSIYGNMVELFRIIGMYVWTALYWYDPLIYSYVSTYDICIILYYWMWLVIWSLFIHVKYIKDIEIGNWRELWYYIGN